MSSHGQIFIKSKSDIKEFADDFRKIINCNSTNQSKWQIDQEREGINMGGLYFLFEVMGLEIRLLKNEGEVLEERFKDYDYYLICLELEPINTNNFKSIIAYLSLLLQRNGIDNFMEEI